MTPQPPPRIPLMKLYDPFRNPHSWSDMKKLVLSWQPLDDRPFDDQLMIDGSILAGRLSGIADEATHTFTFEPLDYPPPPAFTQGSTEQTLLRLMYYGEKQRRPFAVREVTWRDVTRRFLVTLDAQ